MKLAVRIFAGMLVGMAMLLGKVSGVEAASCRLEIAERGRNQLTVVADVWGYGSYPGYLNWGDGSSVRLGNGGNQHVHHAYSYDGNGAVSYKMWLEVSGAVCELWFNVDDTFSWDQDLRACPGGVGPEGITAGNYVPQNLSYDQRKWLWEVFGHDTSQGAPAGYGGERCKGGHYDVWRDFSNFYWASSGNDGSYAVVIATPKLRVRSGPSNQYETLSYVSGGEVCVVHEASGSWGRVSCGREGWVHLGYTQRF